MNTLMDLIQATPCRLYIVGGMFHGGSRTPDDLAVSLTEALATLGLKWPPGTIAVDVESSVGDWFEVQPINKEGKREGYRITVPYDSLPGEDTAAVVAAREEAERVAAMLAERNTMGEVIAAMKALPDDWWAKVAEGYNLEPISAQERNETIDRWVREVTPWEGPLE